MKDYYYILGINKDSSEIQIKSAYKKLTIKFHPDKNEGDKFFEERFKEILEAYEILSDYEKKKSYDLQLKSFHDKKGVPITGENFFPLIEVFNSSKSEIYGGDSVEIKWSVFNADDISISGIGKVNPFGKKEIVINNLNNKEYERIWIKATNTFIGKTEEKLIKIKNSSYDDIIKEHKEKEYFLKDKKYASANEILVYVILGAAILGFIIFLFIK